MGKVSANISFGLELECVRLHPLAGQIIEQMSFGHHLDHSIKGDNGEILPRSWPGAGHEIVTKPTNIAVSMGSDGARMQMEFEPGRNLILQLTSCSEHVNRSCGVHLHLGKPKGSTTVSRWSPDEIRTMLIIGQILEQRLTSMVHPSRLNNDTCELISKRYTKNDLGQFYPMGRVDPNKYTNRKRYCWLNLIETARQGTRPDNGYGSSPATGTIEIRFLGETDCPSYIFMWTRLWLKIAALVAYVPSTLAIAQVCYSDLLEQDFFALKTAATIDLKKRSTGPTRNTVVPSEPVNISPASSSTDGHSRSTTDGRLRRSGIVRRIQTSNTTTSSEIRVERYADNESLNEPPF